MGQGALDYIGVKGGLDINGLIEDYYVYAGDKISSGDFVEFINGVVGQSTVNSEDTVVSSATYHGAQISACKLTENKVFIAHSSTYPDASPSQNYLMGIVCTIDGAKITCGTNTQLSSQVYSGHRMSVVALTSSSVFIAHSWGSAYHLYGAVCTISGTAITIGTDTVIMGENSAGYPSVVKLSSTKVFIAHNYNPTYYYLYGTVCTISGTTITAGSNTSLDTSAMGGLGSKGLVVLSDTSVFISYCSTASQNVLLGLVCTISGTTITKGTRLTISNTNDTGYTSKPVSLSTGKVFIAHSWGSSHHLYGIICTISGTTITAGTDTVITSYSETAVNSSVALLPSGRLLIFYSGSSYSYSLRATVITVSDMTISLSNEIKLSTIAYSGRRNQIFLLSDDVMFQVHPYGTDWQLYARTWRIMSDDTPTREFIVNTYETQVRKTTKVPCAGVAKTSGIGGDATSHNQKIQIYYHPENLLSRDWSTVSSTEYTSDDIILTADSFSGAVGDVLKYACDGDTSTYWASANGINHWITAEFKNSIKPLEMKLQIGNNSYFSNAIIQGGQDNVNWNNLYTINTNLLGSLTTISLASVKSYYKYLRIYFTMTQSAQAFAYEWQITKYVF